MPLTRGGRDRLTAQSPVEGESRKDLPLVDVLTQAPLRAPGHFLPHPPRRRIPRHMGCVDPMPPQALAPLCHHGMGRLAAVASIPVGCPKPLVEFRMGVLWGDAPTNGAQERVVRTPPKSDLDECTALRLLLVGANPFLCHAIFVGVWDGERGRGDLALPSAMLDIAGISQGAWSEDQTGCFQCWTFFKDIVLSGAPNARGERRATGTDPRRPPTLRCGPSAPVRSLVGRGRPAWAPRSHSQGARRHPACP